MPLRVMVVDDRAENLLLLSRFLATLNCEVRTCVDPCCAPDLARVFQPELAVLDHEMPGMNGLAVAQALLGLSLSPLWIVSWTGACDQDLEFRYRAMGCDAFLPKPARGCEITRLIADVRCRRQAQRCARPPGNAPRPADP